jgi:hypothetical protein
VWGVFNNDIKKTLKYSARISEIKDASGITYFIVQLIGKNTCSHWMTALELVQNKQLFTAMSPTDQEFAKSICGIEFNWGIESEKALFYISAIDFEPECIFSITSIN